MSPPAAVVVVLLSGLAFASCAPVEPAGRQAEGPVRLGSEEPVPEPTEPDEALALPATGTVAPHVLRDGTEVFLAHVDGDVFAVEAESPMSHDGMRVLVGWCTSSERFEEPFYASSFDAAGHWVGGPASRGLTPRAVHVRDGTVVVGGPLPPPAREAPSPAPTPPDARPTCAEKPVPDDPRLVRHHVPAGEAAMSPRQRLSSPDAAPLPVTGALERVGPATLRMCGVRPPAHDAGPVCTEEAVPVESLPFEWLDLTSRHHGVEPGHTFGTYGTYLMSVHDGQLRPHAILPGLWAYGGWVPGTEPIVATGKLLRQKDAGPGEELLGLRPDEEPTFVLVEPDGTRRALYPAHDVAVSGGTALVAPGVGGMPTSLDRVQAVLDDGIELTVRVTIRRRDGATIRIEERA